MLAATILVLVVLLGQCSIHPYSNEPSPHDRAMPKDVGGQFLDGPIAEKEGRLGNSVDGQEADADGGGCANFC